MVDEDQPLNEPLLPTHHGSGFATRPGRVSMAKSSPSSSRGAGGRIGRVGGGRGTGSGGSGNDSFVYQIVRSQRERTETTI